MSQRPNLLSPEARDNPYAFYAMLRRESPVCQVDPGGLWVITRHDDVVAVLKNYQAFSSEGFRVSAEPPWLGLHNPITDSILLLDPPKHGRLRTLVSRAFGTSTQNRLEPRMRAFAEKFTKALLERRTVDFIEAFAIHLPAAIIGDLLGLDPSLHKHLHRWADDIFTIGATSPDDHARIAAARQTIQDMEMHMTEVIQSRRRNLGDDIVSDLMRSQVDGESLSEKELLGFLFLLLVAGFETTMTLLTNAGLTLVTLPEVAERVRSDLSLIPQFIEEVLRYEPPVHGLMRLTTTEVEVAGVRIPAFSPVLVLTASALRDESQFPNADRFDLDRGVQANLAFGQGPHYCLGASLARQEARIALETLLTHCRLALRTERLEWNLSLHSRRPAALPVEVTPA